MDSLEREFEEATSKRQLPGVIIAAANKDGNSISCCTAIILTLLQTPSTISDRLELSGSKKAQTLCLIMYKLGSVSSPLLRKGIRPCLQLPAAWSNVLLTILSSPQCVLHLLRS
jgi:hypothetical protein